MRHLVRLGSIGLVLALSTGAAYGAVRTGVQAASGKVVAVTEGSRTIVIESRLNGQPWIIGAEATEDTQFGGKAKDISDIKPGQNVTIRWVRQENGDIARSITVG